MTELEKFFKETLDLKKGDWVWCLHCERAFMWNGVGDLCQYEGCDGSPIDFFKWAGDSSPRLFHSEYPEIPIEGVYYSAYSL